MSPGPNPNNWVQLSGEPMLTTTVHTVSARHFDAHQKLDVALESYFEIDAVVNC